MGMINIPPIKMVNLGIVYCWVYQIYISQITYNESLLDSMFADRLFIFQNNPVEVPKKTSEGYRMGPPGYKLVYKPL